MRVAVLALLALAPVARAAISAADSESSANPIRKVVNLLQAMQKKVTQEGEKEKELYEKFMCYCKTSGGDLSATISLAEKKVPDVGSNIEEAESKLTQLKEELKQAQVDRSSAEAAMAEAKALREKEAAAYAAEKTEYETNIAAIKAAVAALEKGMAGGFLQTNTAQILKKIIMNKQDMPDMDREDVLSFLSGQGGDEYAPKSGEIVGILKQMGDSMQTSLDEATEQEKAAIKSFEDLMAAKTKEVKALTAAIESKTTRIGELGVEIVQMKQDLSDTEAALLEDKKFLANLDKSCETKTAEWEERSKTRAEELVALADTIKVLNDDDALDLFKKTLPGASASLVQVSASTNSATKQAKALTLISAVREARPRSERAGLDLLALALSGKRALSKGGFDKVIKMIDNMVAVLKEEQLDDEHKKEHCEKQFDLADDKKKDLERDVSDETASVETSTESIETLKEEIETLEKCIKDLDKDVAEQTEQRKEENVEYTQLMASNTAAKELLHFAKNRLNKFYNPKLYKAAPKRELTEEERIAVANGGTLAPTEAGGIAGTGITVFAQISLHTQKKDAPPPPPATWDAYAKKSGETTGVISMIDLLIKDLDKEMAEAETEEKTAQAEYEDFMKDSAEKRMTDTKALSSKGSAKAELESDLESHKEEKVAKTKELMATMKYIESLHAECDWLLQYFDVRKEARSGEIDALVKAKAVLNGADFSFVQTRASGFLQRSA